MMSPLRGFALAAVLLAPVPASAAILVQIDKSSQRMTVSQDGRALYTWPVSTGKRGHSTPSGAFKTFRMEKDHFSREWDDAPMPHSIFFTQNGHAIHGSNHVKAIGTPASHGCVRLSPEHAATLFAMVKADGVLNTQVVLTGVEPAPLPSQNVPVARAPNTIAPQNQNENYVARNAPPNDAIDNQVYGDSRLPPPTYQPRAPIDNQAYGDGASNYPRYQQRAPIDDQRYAYETAPPPSYYRQQQPYGRPYYPPQPQPYYGSRYRDPYYDNPPPPPANYRRGFFSYGWN